MKQVTLIDVQEWDKLVRETYGKPYNFQQQEGCKDRGVHDLTVPDRDQDFEMNDSISEREEDQEMGVKFQVWLDRDPSQPLDDQEYDWQLSSWWERNFYPDVQAVANDLHSKGLLEAGDYLINIEW